MKSNQETKHKKKFIGQVVKKSGDKSIVVEVQRRLQHGKYKKFVLRTKKYHAHDENNKFFIGDTVSIIESRPISKLKRWSVVE